MLLILNSIANIGTSESGLFRNFQALIINKIIVIVLKSPFPDVFLVSSLDSSLDSSPIIFIKNNYSVTFINYYI